MRFDQNGTVFSIPQELVSHAILESDRHEPGFYNVLYFEHPYYDISLSAREKNIWKKSIKSQLMVSKDCQ